ncbi:MAG: hypothetical protein WC569_02605 [Candidatus Omnitrophota bacterium]
MRLKKITALFMLLGLITLCVINRAGADETSDPYSAKPPQNIGAWTDETWEASGFYKTREEPGQDAFKYSFTTNPETAVNPTYSASPSYVNGHIVPGASLRSDLVVTEWRVTGHVHFTTTAGGT